MTARVPVSLMDVSAGSNESDAYFSFDDNERTEWRSSGPRADAWINYKLSRQAELSEICMKLSDWKNRTYQIRILNEEGVVLWEGTTETSYGYITLPLAKGVVSNSVRVELSGAGREKVAVSNPGIQSDKNLGSPDNNSSKDDLRIVEIEFYELAE
jgi:beta-galactosidase